MFSPFFPIDESVVSFLSSPSSDIRGRCAVCDSTEGFSCEKVFNTLPPILIVHLDRQNSVGGDVYKDARKVNYSETLILRVHDDEVSFPVSYALVAVMAHSGASTTSGHYLAHVKRGKRWFLCNDKAVTPAPNSHSTSADAVLFIYECKWLANGK